MTISGVERITIKQAENLISQPMAGIRGGRGAQAVERRAIWGGVSKQVASGMKTAKEVRASRFMTKTAKKFPISNLLLDRTTAKFSR